MTEQPYTPEELAMRRDRLADTEHSRFGYDDNEARWLATIADREATIERLTRERDEWERNHADAIRAIRGCDAAIECLTRELIEARQPVNRLPASVEPWECDTDTGAPL